MKELLQSTLRHLRRKGVQDAEAISSHVPASIRVSNHQVKIEPLEDPRGVSRKVRVSVFERDGSLMGTRDVTKSGKAVADAITEVLESFGELRESEKQKLTRERLRQIIREEKRKLKKENVRGMQGDVKLTARGKGDYLLTVTRSSGSKTAVLSKSQLQDLLDLITIKI